MKYQYTTVMIKFFARRYSLEDKIQAALDEKAKDGWRLVTMQFADGINGCYLIFEKPLETA